MHSSIFSSSLAFFGVVLAFAVAVETYCRASPRFSTLEQSHIARFTTKDASSAVLGDSQVAWTNHIPGYEFFGTAGQQPEELLRIVKYLYAIHSPRFVILQAAPQWFGQYHIGRDKFVTADALPPRYLKVLMLSPYFYRPLKTNLETDIVATLRIGAAHAELLSKPSTDQVAAAYAAYLSVAGSFGLRYEWDKLDPVTRRVLTLHRVHEQNPVEGFEHSEQARTFDAAISFLVRRGAKLCLFRTPVTAEYLQLAHTIPGSNYAAFDRYITALAVRHNVRYVTFTNLTSRLEDKNFFNQDHLNEQSAPTLWSEVRDACFA